MKASYQSSLLQLRLLVAFLGERAQFAWWPTAFFESSSRSFLEPVFSKTSKLAQYHGVVEAARRLHDEHLNVGSYHLFRLPEEIEQDLHAMVHSGEHDGFIGQALQSKENALSSLKKMAEETTAHKEGPVAVGKIKDINWAVALKSIASAYITAFNKNTKAYPYLVS